EEGKTAKPSGRERPPAPDPWTGDCSEYDRATKSPEKAPYSGASADPMRVSARKQNSLAATRKGSPMPSNAWLKHAGQVDNHDMAVRHEVGVGSHAFSGRGTASSGRVSTGSPRVFGGAERQDCGGQHRDAACEEDALESGGQR